MWAFLGPAVLEDQKLESGLLWRIRFKCVCLMNVRVCALSYGDFLLCDYNDAVGTSDPHWRQPALRDGFKGIFCKKEVEKSRFRFNKSEEPHQMRMYRLQHASTVWTTKYQRYKKPVHIPNHYTVGSVAGFDGNYLDSDEAKLDSDWIRSLGNKRAHRRNCKCTPTSVLPTW